MDDDHQELTNQLFATATAMLEEAIEVAVTGQSSRLTPSQLAHHGQRLQAAARDIAIIAEAAMIIVKLSVNYTPDQRKRRR